MRKKQITGIFPARGLSANTAFQSPPLYSTPDCLNVRPEHAGDTVLTSMKGRLRGGRRPGLKASHIGGPWPAVADGGPMTVRMISPLNPVRNDDLHEELDGFLGDELDSTRWEAIKWIDGSSPADGVGDMPGVWPDDYDDPDNPISYENPRGAMRKAVDDFNPKRPYTIELQVSPQDGSFNGKYSVLLLFDDGATTDASVQDGVIVELEMTAADGTFTGKIYHYVGGTEQLTGTGQTFDDLSESPIGDVDDGALEVLVIPTLDENDAISRVEVQVFWKDHLLHSASLDGAPSGSRCGFKLEVVTAARVCFADWFNVIYHSTATDVVTNDLTVMMSAGGILYRESRDLTTFGKITSACTLASDRSLHAVQWGGKLYIADWGDIAAQGSDGVINTNGTELRNTEGFSWVDRGINENDFVAVITNPQGGVIGGTVNITKVSSDGLTLARNMNSDTSANGGGTCHYRIERAPKVYDPNTGTLEIKKTDAYESGDTGYVANQLAQKGEVPTGCKVIAVFRDSIMLAGSAHNPRLWFKSRQGDPLDYDFSFSDAGAAVGGAANAQAGIPGDAITALATHTDDYLLLGTRSMLFKFEGDPADGGQLVNLSQTVGIISGSAWCYGPAGEVFFLSYAGLQAIPPGADGYPKSVSDEIPDMFSIADTDRDQYEAFLEYDINARGIHVYFTKTDASPTALSVPPVQTLTSITRSGSTATATSPVAHLIRAGQSTVISGAGQSEYNGTKVVVTVPTPTTFTFAVTGTPATPATGTIISAPVRITRSGTTATVQLGEPHYLRSGRRVLVSGGDQTEDNGDHIITVTGAYSFTLKVSGSPATPATGTIVVKVTGIHLWWAAHSGNLFPFPVSLPLDWEPTAITAVNGRFGTDSAVYVGGRGGYIGAFRDAFEQDGTGENFDSYVYMGPFGFEAGTVDTMVTEVSANMAEDSSSVTWSIHGGTTPEQALGADAFDSGTWQEGANYTSRPRMRARAFYMKIAGPGDNPWGMENIQLVLEEAGRQRLL